MSRHLYLLMVVWVVLQVVWPANPSASWWSSCGQWRLFVLCLLLLVSVTFLCKHFMFFIYIVYVYMWCCIIICCALWSLLKFRGTVSLSLKYVYLFFILLSLVISLTIFLAVSMQESCLKWSLIIIWVKCITQYYIALSRVHMYA
jgi:hypothetical protein